MYYPSISVVLPVYNGEKHILKCIESLLSQSYPQERVEIIIVDNGSTDKTLELLERYSSVKIFFESKRGSYAARNTGVLNAKGEVLAFIDSDCVADENWLNKAVENLKLVKKKGVIGGRVEFFEEQSTVWGFFDTATFLNQEKAIDSGSAVTANLIVPKETFLEIGFFDAELQSGGDVEWTKRAKSSKYNIYYCSDVTVFHPVRSSYKAISKKCFRVGYGNGQILRKTNRLYAMIKPSVSIPIFNKIRRKNKKVENSQNPILFKLQLLGVTVLMQFINYYGKINGILNLSYTDNNEW